MFLRILVIFLLYIFSDEEMEASGSSDSDNDATKENMVGAVFICLFVICLFVHHLQFFLVLSTDSNS